MANVTIGLASAKNIAERIDWTRMSQIADAAREYIPQVKEELAELEVAVRNHPETMARRIFLFGITTPNRSEDQSIAYALAAEPFYGVLSPEDLARISFTVPSGKQGKAGFHTSLERSISDSMATLGTHFDPWALASVHVTETLRGVGPKVARMMCGISCPYIPRWTVDLWHQRQLLWAADLPHAVRVSVADNAYATLEALWIEYAHRYFEQEQTFAVQWATWCAAQGQFVSHRALWADLA